MQIDVLDKGYVRYVDHMGTDLSVVNAARVSFDKESMKFTDQDKRLIKFLAENEHSAPFRHAFVSLECYAPLMVARQWWKYVVGSDHTMDAWNESSRRYVTEDVKFYIPHPGEWRSAPENKKQGSGDIVDTEIGMEMTQSLMDYCYDGEVRYEHAMNSGVCAEQARLFLPAYGMYIRWRWSTSLQSVCHFLNQRIAHDAQKEIQLYALAVNEIVRPLYPASIEAMVDLGDGEG